MDENRIDQMNSEQNTNSQTYTEPTQNYEQQKQQVNEQQTQQVNEQQVQQPKVAPVYNYQPLSYTQQVAQPSGNQKKKKKEKGFGTKLLQWSAIAACFGFVAGGIMFGVNLVGNTILDASDNTTVTVGKNVENNSESKKEVSVTNSNNKINVNSEGIQITDVSDVVEEVMPSVVAITSTTIVNPGYSFWFQDSGSYEQKGAGSGIIVAKSETELLIVTNNHVVEDADSLSVQFVDGKSVDAYIKGTSAKDDLAVVSIPLDKISEEIMDDIKIATLGSSDDIQVGDGCIAIGNALGYGQSVTTGVISAKDREVTVSDSGNKLILLQTDAAINPGNSGGALLNAAGEVIGINSAKYSSDSIEGMGFAIPISSASEIINNLMNKQTRTKVDESEQGYIGINGSDVDASSAQMYGIPEGVYIYSTIEGGAAAKAGMKKGYVITALDGEKISTLSELKDVLEYYRAGEKVMLTVQVPGDEDYSEQEIEVTLTGKLETNRR